MKSMYRVAVVALVASTRWLPQSAAAPNLGFGASSDDMHLSGDPLYGGSMAGIANGYLGVKQPNNPTTSSSGALDSDDDTTSLSSSNTSSQSSSLWSGIQSGYDQVSDFLTSTWQNTFGTKENVPTVLRTSVEAAGGFGPMLRNIVTSLPQDTQDFINKGWYSGFAAQQVINIVQEDFTKAVPSNGKQKCLLDNANALLADIYDPNGGVVTGTKAPFSYSMLELFLLTTKQILGSNDHPLVDDILKDLVPFANSANEQLPIILGTLDEHLMAMTSLTPEMKLKAFTTFIETYFLWAGATSGMEQVMSEALYHRREEFEGDIFYDAYKNSWDPNKVTADIIHNVAQQVSLVLLSDALKQTQSDLKDCEVVATTSAPIFG